MHACACCVTEFSTDVHCVVFIKIFNSPRGSRNKTNNAQRTQCTHLFQADEPNQMLQNSRIFSRSLVVGHGFTWMAAREECEIDECFTLLVVPSCVQIAPFRSSAVCASGRRRLRTFMIDEVWLQAIINNLLLCDWLPLKSRLWHYQYY